MAWWQKKILRFALSRTGLLDDKALDLDHLDIALGRTNVIELKDVGLNIIRISRLAQLPPGVRVETARILSLRLTVPADIYQSSIIAELDGLELSLKLEDSDNSVPAKKQETQDRSPVTARSPQHRKVHRRVHSPPPYDPADLSDYEEANIPTTEELAKSFLQEEPVQERRELEASVVANAKALEESVSSESSTGDELGIGGTIGLPGFLAGFLQGIVDRLQVRLKNVEAKLETEVPADGQETLPVTLHLHVGQAELDSVTSSSGDEDSGRQHEEPRRRIHLQDVSLNLLSDISTFSDLSELPSHDSPAQSRQQDSSSPILQSSYPGKSSSSRSQPTEGAFNASDGSAMMHSSPEPPDGMQASLMTEDLDRFADAGEERSLAALRTSHAERDIQPGDDNLSWGSRRSKSSAPVEDLWKSMASEDDLPESLLLERASTPRAQSSRSQSPNVIRTKRDVSPYGRSFQSPGSWPRIEESPQRRRLQPSPGSWPTLDQSQQSMFQSMTSELETHFHDATDNKRAAIQASMAENYQREVFHDPSVGIAEDLAASRMFNHEAAKSMYMSAMTQSPKMHVPGGWSEGPASEMYSSPKHQRRPLFNLAGSADLAHQQLDEDLAYSDRPYTAPAVPRSGNVTPKAQSPEPARIEQVALNMNQQSSKQLAFINEISMWLPNPRSTKQQERSGGGDHPSSASVHPQGMPGTFSAYSEMTASRRQPASSARKDKSNVTWAQPEPSQEAVDSQPLAIVVGSIQVQVDIPSSRLLYRLAMKASPLLGFHQGSQATQKVQPSPTGADSPAMTVSVGELTVALKESVDAPIRVEDTGDTQAGSALAVRCRNIELSSKPGQFDVRIGSFSTFLGTSCFLCFNRSRDMETSMITSEQTPDIALLVATRRSAAKRPITEVTIETLPVDVLLDLPVIDEAFGSFGGLSGVFELGNSILSESAVGSSPSSAKPSKGVRFEGDPQYIGTDPELKINSRVGGINAILQASTCNINLRTTTVKAVYREQGVVATIERVLFSGPHISEDSHVALSIELSTLRLDYLFSPQDKDLERLLSLLTPSKDQYQNDDDILIDTLLRQRRKGAVLRTSVAFAQLKCLDLERLTTLSTLSDELGKLSAVAKYLPEDERPGLLTLLRVKEYEARLPVDKRFGDLQVNILDFHCAHVGLPALLAVSVGDVNASQTGGLELVHSLALLSGTDKLPMVMARMLGGEVEPTVKIKLFNICVEYDVSVVLALTSLDDGAKTEDIVAELAKSVANLAFPEDESHNKITGPGSDVTGSQGKKTNIDLLIHDSAVGLNPHNLTSKALLVLTDAWFSSIVPPEDTLTAALELRKAGLFVADQVISADTAETAPLRGLTNNTVVKPKLTMALAKQGFVSVGSIMAAKISVRAEGLAQTQDKSMDVTVRNELLLLETCADSTQTLMTILGALSPPTPPSKQPKYHTEPMTIEDMMASFTGDAYSKQDEPPTTLFDIEEEPLDEPDLMLDIPTLDEDDDGLLADSEMTSSLYGPIGGMIGETGDMEDQDTSDDFPETVESFLEEEDPFEMPISPTDVALSDSALIKELSKQCRTSVKDVPMDLGLYEVEDLGFDALGGSQQALGNKYRFNTPAVRGQKSPGKRVNQSLPFKLSLRDVHVIWNIYDGYDWQRTREGITKAVEQVETRAEQRRVRRHQSHNEREEEESVIGDFLFNSIYIGVPSNHDAQELRRQINRHVDDQASETESVPLSVTSRPTAFSTSGRPARHRQQRRLKLERSKAHKIAFELRGVSADVLVYPPDSADIVSSIDVRVKDLEIFDNVPTSTWRKFLTHQNNDPSAREMSKPMMHVELLNVRTLENFAASEIAMHVTVLPLRLHVDQDALDFITRFFEFKDESVSTATSGGDQPFLQRVEVDTVDMRLDYKPKKVDYVGVRSGHTTEFMNFIGLDAADIRLKHAIIYGIKGFEPLHKTLNDVWMPDIQRNQLPTILAGLAPVRSLVSIGSGVRDVIAIPVREYRKDGRIVRSIQKGAYHFGKTTASELARLGAKVAIGTQNLLQGAEGFLTPDSASPSGRPGSSRRVSSDQGWQDVSSEDETHERRAISAYANQPLGVLSGLRSAGSQLEHDLLNVRDALIAVQGEVMESSSPGSAAAALVKYAPTVILRPIIGTSRAVGTTLLGVGNQIDRSNMRRVEDKYKRR